MFFKYIPLGDLWDLLEKSKRSSNVTVDACVEVDRYLSETNLLKPRMHFNKGTHRPVTQTESQK